MTNVEPESVEPTPEATAEDEAPATEAPEVPAAEEQDATPKKRTGLIAGLSTVGVLVVAGAIVLGLWLGGVIFKDAGNPASVVKSYFAARTCAAAQAQLAPAEWTEMSSASGSSVKCDDKNVASTLGAIKVAVQSTKISDNLADVEITVTSTSSPTPQHATINLIQVKGKWKIDHIIAKAS